MELGQGTGNAKGPVMQDGQRLFAGFSPLRDTTAGLGSSVSDLFLPLALTQNVPLHRTTLPLFQSFLELNPTLWTF